MVDADADADVGADEWKRLQRRRTRAKSYHPGQWRHTANNQPYSWTCCYGRVKDGPGCKALPAAKGQR
jgi:hypothetical protein